MSKLYSIAETFHSVQGEGCRVGTYCAFIRFAGCDLHCPYCDTDHHAREALSATQLVRRIGRYPVGKRDARWVVLTGGEPLWQVDAMLVKVLHANDWFVAVETNGHALPQAGVFDILDHVTVSPKSSEAFRIAPLLRGNTKVELKVVLPASGAWTDMQLETAGTVARFLSVQPVFEGGLPIRESLLRCVEFIRRRPWWRLSVQTHKFLRMR